MIIKKIFAVVSEKHFYMFRKQAYDIGLTFGKALELLAIEYAEGRITLNHKKQPKEEKKKVVNFYLKNKEANHNGLMVNEPQRNEEN